MDRKIVWSKIGKIEQKTEQSKEGPLAKTAKAESLVLQDLEYLRDTVERGNIFKKAINSPASDAILPETYHEIFMRHAIFCKTRPRPAHITYNGEKK